MRAGWREAAHSPCDVPSRFLGRNFRYSFVSLSPPETCTFFISFRVLQILQVYRLLELLQLLRGRCILLSLSNAGPIALVPQRHGRLSGSMPRKGPPSLVKTVSNTSSKVILSLRNMTETTSTNCGGHEPLQVPRSR